MEEKNKITEQVIENPVQDGLRILGRMIARQMYERLHTIKNCNKSLEPEKEENI